MRSRGFIIPIALGILLGLLLPGAIGCGRGTYVWVKQDQYQPSLPLPFHAFRGHIIHLPPFTNEARNASYYYYYSVDGQVTYEGSPSLQEYLRSCFRKALENIRMTVAEEPVEPPAPPLPELQITFTAWSDEQFRYQATLVRAGQPSYSKEYTVVWNPGPDRQPELLEQQAYRMVDAMVTALLVDPGFQAALLGGPAGS